MTKSIKLKLIALMACIGSLLVGCDNNEKAADIKELKRVDAPDQRVQAVLVTKDYDATVPTVYELYIVPKGKPVSKENMVFRADHMSDVVLHWRAPKLLVTHYKTGRIFQFSNFWQSKEVDNFGYIVEIRLQPPETSLSLPSNNR